MRTTALSALVILGATLAAGSPLRVVVTTHQEVSSNGVYAGTHHADNLAHILQPVPYDVSITSGPVHGGRRPLCQTIKNKALEASNRFRAIFGFAPIEAAPTPDDNLIRIMPFHAQPRPKLEHGHPHGEDERNNNGRLHVLPIGFKADGAAVMQTSGSEAERAPILPFIGTPVRPAFAMAEGEERWGMSAPGGRNGHRFHRHRGSFLRRVHHALVVLGPWEGRAVAFVLGCGIGVLLRMVWVMALVTVRAIRGPSTDRDSSTSSQEGIIVDGYTYDVVFDEDAEDILAPPPQYTVAAHAPIEAADAKEEKQESA
ncbi:hypothetical protein FKP32DRAFT_1672967 [Trametes sanguinea]|nr:hypothetical protein FKP32DRAFT_1672967 [Trametes sanguinea]